MGVDAHVVPRAENGERVAAPLLRGGGAAAAAPIDPASDRQGMLRRDVPSSGGWRRFWSISCGCCRAPMELRCRATRALRAAVRLRDEPGETATPRTSRSWRQPPTMERSFRRVRHVARPLAPAGSLLHDAAAGGRPGQ
jgi:hypothetical protein